MFRIKSQKNTQREAILTLEGKICRSQLKNLSNEIEKILDSKRTVILDLEKVLFIDDETARLLQKFSPKKVKYRKGSLFVRTMLNLEGKDSNE